MLLVEIKAGDAVRDEQAVWHDRLVRAGAPIEVWAIEVTPGSGRTAPEPR
ncbi:MAG: hypothetical protein R3F59_08100 [Myxococcota bacterium]